MLCLVVGLFIAPASLSAQLCRGGIDYSDAKIQAQAQLEMGEGSSLYGVAASLGESRYYGSASLAVRTYSEREGETVLLGIGGGRNFRNTFTTPAFHCLELTGDFGTGPDLPGSVRADESSSSVTLELLSGLPLGGTSVQFTPFLGLAIRYASIVTQTDNDSFSVNDFYELISIGMGISGGSYSLQPYAQLPLGRTVGSDPTFGMRFSMTLGRR